MSKDIVDVLRYELLPLIDNTVKVKSVVSNVTTYTLVLCSIKWLKVGRLITIGSYEFQVISINYLTNEVVVNISDPLAVINKHDVGTIIRPTFIHGTKYTANIEWLKSIQFDLNTGLPLIWLYESINESVNEQFSPFDSEASLRLFFLDYIDLTGDSLVNENGNLDENFQIRKQGVKPMLSLSDSFLDTVDESYKVERSSNSNRTTFSIFANENSKNGEAVYERILDANLGGVEIRPTLSIYKGVECC